MLANSRALQAAWDSAVDRGAQRPRELQEEPEISATPKIRRSGVHRPRPSSGIQIRGRQ